MNTFGMKCSMCAVYVQCAVDGSDISERMAAHRHEAHNYKGMRPQLWMLTPHDDTIKFYSLDDAEYWLHQQLESIGQHRASAL